MFLFRFLFTRSHGMGIIPLPFEDQTSSVLNSIAPLSATGRLVSFVIVTRSNFHRMLPRLPPTQTTGERRIACHVAAFRRRPSDQRSPQEC